MLFIAIFSHIIAFFMARLPKIQNHEYIFVPNCCPVRSYFFMHSGAYFEVAECRTIFAIFSDIIAFFMAILPKIQNDENTIVPY